MKQKRAPHKTKAALHTRFIAVVSIALPLLILGWIGVVELMQRALETKVREEMTFTLELTKTEDEQEAIALEKRLNQEPWVKSVRYISPKEAAEELRDELGEDPEVVLGFNPLYPTLEVHLKAKYADPDSLRKVDSLIRTYKGVEGFSYRSDLLQQVNAGMKKLSLGLLILMILLLVMATIQINNTTHLMIYSKRFLIRSMTLLGAPFHLISRPYISYSILNGFYGGLLASLLLSLSLWVVHRHMGEAVLTYLSAMELVCVGVVLIIVGILLSLIASAIATRRYIRMDGGKMILS